MRAREALSLQIGSGFVFVCLLLLLLLLLLLFVVVICCCCVYLLLFVILKGNGNGCFLKQEARCHPGTRSFQIAANFVTWQCVFLGSILPR